MADYGLSYKTTALSDTPVTLTTPLPVLIAGVSGTGVGYGAANLATGQVTGTISGTTAVVAARPTRYSVTLRHTGTNNTAWVGGVAVNSTTGMPLYAGESIALDYTGAVAFICTGGVVVLAFADAYD